MIENNSLPALLNCSAGRGFFVQSTQADVTGMERKQSEIPAKGSGTRGYSAKELI